MEAEGIRNGSNKKDRTMSTISITGKNERAYPTMAGSGMLPAADADADADADAKRLDLRKTMSRAKMAPDAINAANKMSE